MDSKNAQSVKRAYKKVRKCGDDLVEAKADEDVISAIEKHEKAKASYGRALDKALDS